MCFLNWLKNFTADDTIALFTALLTLFTAILAIATIRLWHSTDKLVRGAEDTAERQLRAYVLVEEAHIGNIIEGQTPAIRITLKNSGQTPAKNLAQWSSALFHKFPTTHTSPKKPDSIHYQSLAAGAEIYSKPKSKKLSNAEIDLLRSGEAAIYVYGEVNYEDAFGKQRQTKYWLFSGGPIGIDTGAMAAYVEGNEYT